MTKQEGKKKTISVYNKKIIIDKINILKLNWQSRNKNINKKYEFQDKMNKSMKTLLGNTQGTLSIQKGESTNIYKKNKEYEYNKKNNNEQINK